MHMSGFILSYMKYDEVRCHIHYDEVTWPLICFTRNSLSTYSTFEIKDVQLPNRWWKYDQKKKRHWNICGEEANDAWRLCEWKGKRIHTLNGTLNHAITPFRLQKGKKSLNPFDDNRYILDDGFNTLPYGHYSLEKCWEEKKWLNIWTLF